MTIEAGQVAPDVTLTTKDGAFPLSHWRGKRVVLYFYPKDNTSGCTAEAIAFQAALPQFEAANTVLIGISKDSLTSHAKFCAAHGLTFPLAVDDDGSLCEAFGVWVEKSMYGRKYMGIDRSTFLIDEQGVVRNVWRKVKVTGHAAAVLKALAAL